MSEHGPTPNINEDLEHLHKEHGHELGPLAYPTLAFLVLASIVYVTVFKPFTKKK